MGKIPVFALFVARNETVSPNFCVLPYRYHYPLLPHTVPHSTHCPQFCRISMRLNCFKKLLLQDARHIHQYQSRKGRLWLKRKFSFWFFREFLFAFCKKKLLKFSFSPKFSQKCSFLLKFSQKFLFSPKLLQNFSFLRKIFVSRIAFRERLGWNGKFRENFRENENFCKLFSRKAKKIRKIFAKIRKPKFLFQH
jgi:hypothetical protein